MTATRSPLNSRGVRSTPGKQGTTDIDPEGVAREHRRLSTLTLLGHSVGVLTSAGVLSVGRSDLRLLSGDAVGVLWQKLYHGLTTRAWRVAYELISTGIARG